MEASPFQARKSAEVCGCGPGRARSVWPATVDGGL